MNQSNHPPSFSPPRVDEPVSPTRPEDDAGSFDDTARREAEEVCICGGQRKFHSRIDNREWCSHLPSLYPCSCQQFIPRGRGLLNCIGCGIFGRYTLVSGDPFCFSCVRERVPERISTKLWTDEEQRLSERAW